MADDKIVTKKTAAKKATPKKTTAVKPSVTENEAKGSTATTTPPAKTRATKKVVSPAPAPATTKPVEPATPKAAAPKKAAAKKPAKTATVAQDTQVSLKQLANVSADQRQFMIEEAAYYKAEKRNFAPGHETEDWADAEREIDELLTRAKRMTGN